MNSQPSELSKASCQQQVLKHQKKTQWSDLSNDEKRKLLTEVVQATKQGDIDKLIRQYHGLKLAYYEYYSGFKLQQCVDDDSGHRYNSLHLAAYNGHLQIVYLIENEYCKVSE